MAKQRKRRDDEAALFVRLPREEADKLDRFVFERRIPKRDVVRRLVAEHLDEADIMWQRPMPPPIAISSAEYLTSASLTHTAPASMRRATASPRAASLEKTDAPRPYGESLASRIASSASATFMIGSAGPKVSSRMTSIVWSTPTSTVG